jgi:fructose-1,6-bisphosphatase/inositol monophosphatase family enzyme
MELDELEREVLKAWRNPAGSTQRVRAADGPEALLRLTLRLSLLASRLVRSARLGDFERSVTLKSDGSPVSSIERRIEEMIAAELRRSGTALRLIGEESPSGDAGAGLVLAVDPIDGTWSLLNRCETAATSLVLLNDGLPLLSVVSNPATAEIAYTIAGRTPRLLQLSAFGEPDRAVDLPIPPAGPKGLLVSLHPQRAAFAVVSTFSRAWCDGEIDMVRAPGGAPSLGLLEAAKGSFVYVNLWDRRDSAPWDLWAGLTVLRAAGGEAVDPSGLPIQGTGHRGPLIAALEAEDRALVAAIIQRALTSGEYARGVS